MKISKRTIKTLEEKLGLHETRARNPIPFFESLMFYIPDPYDKVLADKYWKNNLKIRKRATEVFEAKNVMRKHLPFEELVKIIEEGGKDC